MGCALLSLGSNLEPERNLAAAAAALRARFPGVRFSPVYRVPAVGFEGPDFLNAAARLESDLDPVALDAWLHALEDAQGRRRDVPRFSSRTLDIDLVFYDDCVLRGPGHLQLPRPELKHAFVLQPLAVLAPAFRDPLSGRTLAQLWAAHPEHATAASPVALTL
jgi:2-amino-4-hydroxy-6-hydroxymethyldihydropteridine diphosphokinase